MKTIFGFFLIVVLFAVSCRKPDQYPDVPTLSFKSLTFANSDFGKTFTLTATFTDGDGDVGYYQDQSNGEFDDPSSPYYFNLVIKLQRLTNGTWWSDSIDFMRNAFPYDTIFPVSERLPYLTPEGKNKGLKGDINKTDFMPVPNPSQIDTLRFTAFIYDRAKHKSNVIESPVFVNSQ